MKDDISISATGDMGKSGQIDPFSEDFMKKVGSYDKWLEEVIKIYIKARDEAEVPVLNALYDGMALALKLALKRYRNLGMRL